MTEICYANSFSYAILVKKGNLQVIPDEFDRIKKSVSYRIMCVTDGECQLFLSGESCRISKNDICFLRPGDVYRTVPIKKMDAINIYFTFDRDDLEKLTDANAIDRSNVVKRYTVTDLPVINQPFIIKGCAEAVELAAKMTRVQTSDIALARKKRDVILEMILLLLLEHRERQQSYLREDKQLRLVSAVTEFIEKNIHDPITCSSVARHFNYHPNYLNETLNRLTGMSLHRYILEQKIKSVTNELIATDKSIARIAQDYSFCDSSHLTRSYFRVTHLRPSDVRKAAKQ